MPQQKVRFEQFFAAPREKVFAWFADHEKFGRLWPGRTRRIRDAESADVNGLGSVREIRAWPMSVQETITAYEPPRLIEYRVTSEGPIRNHLGRLTFEDVPGGSQLQYTIEFDPRYPLTGGIIAGVLCGSFRRGVHRAIEEITRGA